MVSARTFTAQNAIDRILDSSDSEFEKSLSADSDNAPSHTSQIAMEVIHEISRFKLLEHPLYSPDLGPSDFNLFPHLKNNIHGRKFDCDSVIAAVGVWLQDQDSNFSRTGITSLEH